MRVAQPELEETIKQFPPEVQREIQIVLGIIDEVDEHHRAIRRLGKLAELINSDAWAGVVTREFSEGGEVTTKVEITKLA